MSVEREVAAIRHRVAITENTHVVALRVTGPGAFDLLDRVCPRELFVRDGQILQTVFLDAEGRVWADVEISRDDQDLYVLAEGPSGDQLAAFLADQRRSGVTAEVTDLSGSHRILALNGVYAWELLAELVGPEVVGLPYLTAFEGDGWRCFRAGKTGEFGYYLMTPEAGMAELRDRLLDLGQRFDLATAGVAAIDQCQLENGFLCIRGEGITECTPIDLQQQWRVSYGKEYVGSEALAAQRSAGVSRRTTHVIANSPISSGSAIAHGEHAVGALLQAGECHIRGVWVGLALLERRYAYPGLDVLQAVAGGERCALTTVSAPVINNRSLYVNPQNDSYFSREDETYPPLVLEPTWLKALTGP